ncbi:hypothetical protein JIN84_08805 [Luteolibacter yonseiensis]|uniref:Uncharacterized protein n=1 Tax=Luteolibacter yonseiensis TaxID=1144680 RepID=A0A934R2L9_9BACT|nr:hypothetical protein [Luteolibacter yonseiensis]MBK1815714.1 hypothetical protein [Luteolibacter yonseiensis]
MPHSRFTRYLAFGIIAAYALLLLWPDPSVYEIASHAFGAMPFLIALFTWSAVRDAPPLDDHAFHRTLPTNDARVFARTLLIHGMVLAGISLAIVAGCLLLNFGWRMISFGLAVLTMPAWTLMAACGLATSAATSSHHRKSWAYLAIFVMPLLSAAVLYRYRLQVYDETRLDYEFGNVLTMALAGAVLYPLCWWLVAVGRRRTLGLSLGMVIGSLMPWIFVSERFDGEYDAAPSYLDEEVHTKTPVRITRKADMPGEEKWVRVDDVLDVRGLRDGEFLHLSGISFAGKRADVYEIPDDPAVAAAGVYRGRLLIGRFGGEDARWGAGPVWDHLRKRIPAHETFEFWNPHQNVPAHLAFLKHGEPGPVIRDERGLFFRKPRPREWDGEKYLAEGPLKWVWAEAFHMEKVGEVGARNGGTCRLPEGGIIRFSGIFQVGTDYWIEFQNYQEDTGNGDISWLGMRHSDISGGQEPWVIAVDESGKHTFALGPWDWEVFSPILLGAIHEKLLRLGTATTPAEISRMEMLKKCRLHVFWPKRDARRWPVVKPTN